MSLVLCSSSIISEASEFCSLPRARRSTSLFYNCHELHKLWLVRKTSSECCQNHVWPRCGTSMGVHLSWPKLQCTFLSETNLTWPKAFRKWTERWSPVLFLSILIFFMEETPPFKGNCQLWWVSYCHKWQHHYTSPPPCQQEEEEAPKFGESEGDSLWNLHSFCVSKWRSILFFHQIIGSDWVGCESCNQFWMCPECYLTHPVKVQRRKHQWVCENHVNKK